MTVTYTEDRITPFAETPETRTEEAFVPVYARGGRRVRRGGKVRTWMILAPIGALVVGGAAAAMLMSGENEAANPALAEPVVAAPVTPITPAPAATSPAVAAAPAPVSAPAPAVREAAPEPARVAPARRAAPRDAAPVAPRAAAPAPSPQAAARTASLNAAPTAALNAAPPAPAITPEQPPQPAIVVQPLN